MKTQSGTTLAVGAGEASSVADHLLSHGERGLEVLALGPGESVYS